jgi:cytochrome c-type biogenesis protein
MIELFSGLAEMLNGSWWIALVSSFIWGILSIVLSPCHLATIPLIVGFINDRESITKGRAALLSSLFALGILITLAVIGVITGLLGRILGDIGGLVNYIVGGFLLLFGIYMLDIIKLPFLERGVKPVVRKKGPLSAFLLGLIFGVALGPCAFAFMAPMFGIVFGIGSTNMAFAMALLFAFAAGHCSIIVLAGTFTEIVRTFLNWNEKSGGVVWMKRVCGILIIVAAVYLFMTAS